MNEQEFIKWLDNEVETIAPLSSYPRALKEFIPNKLNLMGEYKYKSLFECEDINYLKKLKTRLLNNGDLHQFNIDTQARTPSASIQKYINFLKYKLIKKQMELYDNKPDDFELNNATIFFQINNNSNKYPVKALLKSIYQELDLPEDYRTNGAKSKLEQIFKYFDIRFIDNTKQEENLNNKTTIIKNIILYGSPGIGKTHNYKNLISMIEKGENEKEIFDTISKNENILQNDIEIPNERVKFITFHQSYSYEDFIEGFRPQEDGTIKLEDGIFKIICDEASKDNTQNYYLVIDEINRGNISKIFGELITLIEEDKRDNLEVVLPYSKNYEKPLKIPSNLYIIATMNSTDKSIATIDIALRRRFTFIKMKPNSNLVNYLNAKKFMEKVNKYILENLNEDYLIGHSYFMNIENEDDLEFVKKYKIKPLLEEYFYAESKSADDILKEIITYE